MNPKESIVSTAVRAVQFLAITTVLNALQTLMEERNISLPNIIDLNVEENTSIFFLDTTVISDKTAKIKLKARVACSVESAARIHQTRTIYLLYTTPGYVNYNPKDESDEHVQMLMSFDNVVMAYMNITEYTLYTPVEDLIKRKSIEQSEHMRNHYSDVLRVVTVWKYGGIYLDADVMVLKSFNRLRPNFVSAESDEYASNAILAFQNKRFRNTLYWVLSRFNRTYNASDWGENGPVLITRYVTKLCGIRHFFGAINTACRKLFVYPKEHFMPLHVGSWKKYFDAKYSSEVELLTRRTYAIHIWNCSSSTTKLPVNSSAIYMKLAREHCPSVIKNVDSVF